MHANFFWRHYSAMQGMEILADLYIFVRLLHREMVYLFKLLMPIAS